jgi:hypothetical protein
MMRIGKTQWKYGPHYFLKHGSGVRVDPTWDQFPAGTVIPYHLAKGQTDGSFRPIARRTMLAGIDIGGATASRKAVIAALGADPKDLAWPMYLARAWSEFALWDATEVEGR